MAQRSVLARLQDILDNIENIEQFIAGKSLSDFEHDVFLRMAAERALEIISEASRHIPDTTKAGHAGIPWQDIRSIGNIIRHAYQNVEPEVIWKTIMHDLRPLRVAIETMKKEELSRNG
jgi:uncharacterized protein with HEPN domain